MDVLSALFERRFGSSATVQPLRGELGGSGRRIFRLTAGKISAIGILYNVREENAAFLAFSKHFRRHGLPVPEIYAQDLDQGAYLEEDLGDTTLFEFLSANRAGKDIAAPVIEAYRQAVAALPRFQIEAGRDLDYSVCYPRSSFDHQSIAWDLNYFKYYFLRLAGIPFNEQALEDDFGRLTEFLLAAPRDYFLYRDFQSRNIMLREGLPASSITRAAARARCNTISPPSYSTPRPICLPNCAASCSRNISSGSPRSSTSTAPLSCITTTPMFTCA